MVTSPELPPPLALAMPAPTPASARYVPLAPPEQRHGGEGDDEEECCYAARARYVPLRLRREQDQEYAARRALFLQSYRFTTAAVSAGERDDGVGGGLRGRMARRVREAVSRARGAARWWIGVGVARAWPRVGWWWRRPPRARLGCFGGGAHGRSKLHYLHHFA